MSVFTPVSADQLKDWLNHYSVGKWIDHEGITAGIDNTNFFVTTDTGRFVLTLFERLSQPEVDYYLHLMAFLGEALPCARPVPDNEGNLYRTLNGKLAALIVCLSGKNLTNPNAHHCGEVGQLLAKLHVRGQDYPHLMPHPRGLVWCQKTAEKVRPFLSSDELALLDNELTHQMSQDYENLPCGIIHADLFRDNVLFEKDTISGILDFYFAGHGMLLFDVAVTINDWCLKEYQFQASCYDKMLSHYQSIRKLTPEERTHWPNILRLAALRFWLSRLFDKNLPRDGEMVLCHDPKHFERILRQHIQQPLTIPD